MQKTLVIREIVAVACFLCLVFLITCKVTPTSETQPPGLPRTVPVAIAPAMTAPAAILSPFLCLVQPKTLYCQATVDTLLRRGQIERRVIRGSIIGATNPVGSGRWQLWFGCTGSSSCEGTFIFSSKSVTVTPYQGTLQNISGKEDVVPFGSLGIVSGSVENGSFTGIEDRWTGAMAPPLLLAGPGTGLACQDDQCTVSVK